MDHPLGGSRPGPPAGPQRLQAYLILPLLMRRNGGLRFQGFEEVPRAIIFPLVGLRAEGGGSGWRRSGMEEEWTLLLHSIAPPLHSSIPFPPFMGGGRGPMKQFPHARGEHAGFASWGEAAAP